MLIRRFSIQYLSLVIVIFPFIVFLFCALNINIEYDQKVLDELSTSINDYPLSDLNFAPECNDSQQSNVLYTWEGTVDGCNCAEVESYYYKQQD